MTAENWSWVGTTDKGSEYQRGGESRGLIQITMYSSSSHIVTPGCRALSIPRTSEATRMVGDQPFLSDGLWIFFVQFIRNALAGVFRTAEGSGKNNGFRATRMCQILVVDRCFTIVTALHTASSCPILGACSLSNTHQCPISHGDNPPFVGSRLWVANVKLALRVSFLLKFRTCTFCCP
ncbi:hypothetical protein BS47DRAFT_1168807 [Hydnum rufescens UP504]|uniref:Uncharacterized protein n=1 Tax=Hydnum rufescens UP504 TaxID=1448309 RepID=A0A9P6AT95_9AGAM|nr:hypothetical protein BS47DRAFT_1168807 [Hydnum rufescens UP504]